MLSDQGLHQIASDIGREWPHLASLLGVSSARQEQLRLDYPNNTRQQIFEMLKFWRNTTKGHKEQLKGTLYQALQAVNRNDIADLLFQETKDGSVERINGLTSLL
jgi:hypothetical protein